MKKYLALLLSIVLVASLSLVGFGCKEETAATTAAATTAAATSPANIDIAERDYYYWDEIQPIAQMEAMKEIVSKDGIPISVPVDETVRIAMIFPSLELSDAWIRGQLAFEARMEELNIPFELVTMGVDSTDHTKQADHLQSAIIEKYDYVICGPTEMYIQSDAMSQVIAAPDTELIIWNFSTPLMKWGKTREEGQPLAYVNFDHYDGSVMMANYILENYDFKNAAYIYGVVGALSYMRGHTVRDILMANGVEFLYETYCDLDMQKAYEAVKQIVAAYPEVEHIHIISTDMAIGGSSALDEMGLTGDIIINGWGGGSQEQELLLAGKLGFTVFRFQDDWGVAPAEIIKMDLEGRKDEIPMVYSGGMQMLHSGMDRADIDALIDYGFRYSGQLEFK